jgi:membrane protease YdiL (CAAX protease family)
LTLRDRWKQAGLILLSGLAVFVALNVCGVLLSEAGIRALFASYIIGAAACFAAYLAAVRWIERRAPTEFSPARALPAVAWGVAGGIALFSALMAALWIAGAYQPLGWTPTPRLALALLLWLAVGLQEEILYRGLLYRLLSKLLGTWGGLAASALLFGATHALNPNATLAGVSTVVLAGVFFAAAYVATGRLWLPIGLHAGWNLAEGSLFGTAVSGNDIGASLLTGKLSGSALLTGGNFGPEASILAVIVLVPPTAYLLWRIATLRRSEPPIWRAAASVPTAAPVPGAA